MIVMNQRDGIAMKKLKEIAKNTAKKLFAPTLIASMGALMVLALKADTVPRPWTVGLTTAITVISTAVCVWFQSLTQKEKEHWDRIGLIATIIGICLFMLGAAVMLIIEKPVGGTIAVILCLIFLWNVTMYFMNTK